MAIWIHMLYTTLVTVPLQVADDIASVVLAAPDRRNALTKQLSGQLAEEPLSELYAGVPRLWNCLVPSL